MPFSCSNPRFPQFNFLPVRPISTAMENTSLAPSTVVRPLRWPNANIAMDVRLGMPGVWIAASLETPYTRLTDGMLPQKRFLRSTAQYCRQANNRGYTSTFGPACVSVRRRRSEVVCADGFEFDRTREDGETCA